MIIKYSNQMLNTLTPAPGLLDHMLSLSRLFLVVLSFNLHDKFRLFNQERLFLEEVPTIDLLFSVTNEMTKAKSDWAANLSLLQF